MQPYEMRRCGRIRRRQPLEPALLRVHQAHAVHRHGRAVVDPDDFLAGGVATGLG